RVVRARSGAGTAVPDLGLQHARRTVEHAARVFTLEREHHVRTERSGHDRHVRCRARDVAAGRRRLRALTRQIDHTIRDAPGATLAWLAVMTKTSLVTLLLGCGGSHAVAVDAAADSLGTDVSADATTSTIAVQVIDVDHA